MKDWVIYKVAQNLYKKSQVVFMQKSQIRSPWQYPLNGRLLALLLKNYPRTNTPAYFFKEKMFYDTDTRALMQKSRV
jgi:hypothetical protein